MFYSQYGQDSFIYEHFFKDKKNGVFVDIGAHDGKTLSNTLFFEELGWTGYCFEPHPDIYPLLSKNRPNSKCFDVAVSDYDGVTEFMAVKGYAEMLSGMKTQYNEQHINRINSEIGVFGGDTSICEVPVVRLSSVLPVNLNVDYLSLDIEGGESKVIYDMLNCIRPSVISVEANYEEDKRNVLIFCQENNYEYIATLSCDMILKSVQ